MSHCIPAGLSPLQWCLRPVCVTAHCTRKLRRKPRMNLTSSFGEDSSRRRPGLNSIELWLRKSSSSSKFSLSSQQPGEPHFIAVDRSHSTLPSALRSKINSSFLPDAARRRFLGKEKGTPSRLPAVFPAVVSGRGDPRKFVAGRVT